MNIKHIKHFSSFFLFIAALFSGVLLVASPVSADAAGDYCKKYSDKTSDFISMCERQFKYAQEGKRQTCGYAESSPWQSACLESYQAGRSGAPGEQTNPAEGGGEDDICKDSANKDACNAGKDGSNCSEFSGAERASCEQGVARQVCGTAAAGSSVRAIERFDECNSDVRECIGSAETAAVADCMNKLKNTNPEGKKAYQAAAKKRAGDAGNCGEAKTNIITCKGSGEDAIASVLIMFLMVLTAIVGVVAVGGIVYAAILYASASDNSGQVSQAKTIIRDVAIGLLLYGFMAAIINWLVPGGIIK